MPRESGFQRLVAAIRLRRGKHLTACREVPSCGQQRDELRRIGRQAARRRAGRGRRDRPATPCGRRWRLLRRSRRARHRAGHARCLRQSARVLGRHGEIAPRGRNTRGAGHATAIPAARARRSTRRAGIVRPAGAGRSRTRRSPRLIHRAQECCPGRRRGTSTRLRRGRRTRPLWLSSSSVKEVAIRAYFERAVIAGG